MRTLTGKIVSVKMNNTVVVEVIRFVEHKMYKKRIRKTKKFHAHATTPHVVGEIVKIGERSPVSKTKNWVIIGKSEKNAAT